MQQTTATVLIVCWTALVAIGAANGLSQIPCARMMRARGLDTYTLRRVSRALLIAPTSDRSIWKKPEIAQVLLSPQAAAAVEPRSPADYVNAMSRSAQALTGVARDAALEAVAAARGVQGRLEELEREVARLTREADPEEASRLERRLADLGQEGEGEGEERQHMRWLLGQQLELLQRVATRLDAARVRRDELADAMRELWRAVFELSSPTAVASAAALAERLRARCAELSSAEEETANPATITRAR